MYKPLQTNKAKKHLLNRPSNISPLDEVIESANPLGTFFNPA